MGKFKLYENDTVVATRQLGTVPEGAVGILIRVDTFAGTIYYTHSVEWLCGTQTRCNPDDLGLYLYSDLPAEAAYDPPKRKLFHSFL